MSEKLKEVEKMIAKVMKKKDLSRNAAMDYMLIVATGRLAALWRYDESVPEGKTTKGILTLAGPRKKRAPKTPKIAPPIERAEASEPPAKPKRKAAKKRAVKQVKSKSEAQLEIVAAE